ncbi:MAG: GGDEF domain-containing phosphodiesterase [Clostridium perfringens]|uniref:EAL domain-containing protein n=1 Tax=Clostridium perfringens TaxID=1502 RepID=UPI00244534AD|nr:GGDEF domain-containing phosphodiesterase [Clostridium perfringens]MDG6892639.1 Phytochrome-like protein cph2 [Clostridium perfringens]MDU5040361.1 GGDEF domain-containing phosphodiesterase [Clostridium perfringens]
MNKVLKGNLIFLSFILLVTLIFIERYNSENILLILSLIFYLEIIFITREFLKYINLGQAIKNRSIFSREHKNKNKFINKVLLEEKLDHISNVFTRFEFKNNLEMWKGEYTLFLIDLRKFSLINDALGRDKGDEVLREFGNGLNNISKSLASKNLYGVYGGEEFLVAINSKNKEDIIEVLNKLDNLKKIRLNSLNKEIKMEFNIGYSINLGNKSFEEIIEEVFFAKERAKKEDFIYAIEYTEELRSIRKKNNLIIRDIKDALINKKLYTVYQPQISSLDDKIKGYETLIRWNHETLGSISASDIVKTLEEIDAIKDLDLYVFESTCEFQSRLIQNNIELQCSVNISINTLKHRGVGSNLYKISKNYNLKPENITLEILENSDLEVSGNAINEIIKLKKYGFKISIDDFGKGYSSINRVLKIPFDQIKIPKDFISDIPNSKYIAIINSISNFAKTLGAELVIEGVESKEYYDFFKLLDFDVIQGFYFSKALNEKEFLEYVNNLGVSVSI